MVIKQTNMYTCKLACMHACMHACRHTCVCAYTHTQILMYVYMCSHIRTYIQKTCINTYVLSYMYGFMPLYVHNVRAHAHNLSFIAP